MPSLAFCMPAHGRVDLARVCMRQLRRTCDALEAEGIRASAVVVADDENLDTAAELDFATVRRDNTYLSRKFNDALQLALDPAFNPHPFTHACLIGSDDWVDHRLFLNGLPGESEILCFRFAAFVSEDGKEIVSRRLDYEGGVGIRVYPRQMLEASGYRPADEDRQRACDTSILVNVRHDLQLAQRGEPRIVYGDLHEFQIVDWKSSGEQLNSYQEITARHRRGTQPTDPVSALRGVFPDTALRDMHAHYRRALVPA